MKTDPNAIPLGDIAVCAHWRRTGKGKPKQRCGEAAIFLIGTARVPTCWACSLYFPSYVPREPANDADALIAALNNDSEGEKK